MQPEEEKKVYDDGEVKTRIYGAITPKATKSNKSMQELLIDSEQTKHTNAVKMDRH